MKKLTKAEVEEEIKKIENSKISPEEIKKIKKLAMHHNIKLGALRKNFCKKCYSKSLKVKKIKNKMKTVKCENCGAVFRWKMK